MIFQKWYVQTRTGCSSCPAMSVWSGELEVFHTNLDSFCILFIKGTNVKSISCIHLPSWWDQGGRILQRHNGENVHENQKKQKIAVFSSSNFHLPCNISAESLLPTHLLEENHLPVHTLEEGTLLYFKGPIGKMAPDSNESIQPFTG